MSSHTARLKRRAEQEPRLADTNLNESFVTYGTALPSLASTKRDQGDYVPLWQQEVRDEKGRQRLHGAFTGGFSAGYFNTVGSKEGWTPSAFVSSKGAKASAKQQGKSAKPEDFMDDEDLAELKAARGFKTDEQYGYDGRVQSKSGEDLAADSKFDSAMASAFGQGVQIGTSRIGQQIMKHMGWKPGQGVGPRVNFTRRKQQLAELGLEKDGEEEDHEEAGKHLYAPIDRPLILFDAKENLFGLGYSVVQASLHQLSGDQALAATSRGISASNQKSGVAGSAFGISALEEMDEDDADVYGNVQHQQRFVDDDDRMTGPRGATRPELLKSFDVGRQRQNGIERHSRQPLQAVGGNQQSFNDGTSVVAGFVLATASVQADEWLVVSSLKHGTSV